MCDGFTVPMPVSGGCPAFVTITGAAFAPIAVTGGVSILDCRERERQNERRSGAKTQSSSFTHKNISTSSQNENEKEEVGD